jgi:integrase
MLKTTSIKSPSTENQRITFLSGIYRWGIKEGLITQNPLANMEKPTPRVRQTFVPPERFEELLTYANNGNFRDYLIVQLESGARTQDMLRFEAAHLQGNKFVLLIEDSKGNKRSNVIYLPARALEIVIRLAEKHPEGNLFRNSRGRPWTKNAINCAMRLLKKKMKMPGLCATVLRHSYAHWRLTQGQDALTVSKLLNHVDTRMLARRYGHLEGSAFLEAKANEIAMPLPDGDKAA